MLVLSRMKYPTVKMFVDMRLGADFSCCQQLFKNFGSQHWADVELGICI